MRYSFFCHISMTMTRTHKMKLGKALIQIKLIRCVHASGAGWYSVIFSLNASSLFPFMSCQRETNRMLRLSSKTFLIDFRGLGHGWSVVMTFNLFYRNKSGLFFAMGNVGDRPRAESTRSRISAMQKKKKNLWSRRWGALIITATCCWESLPSEEKARGRS